MITLTAGNAQLLFIIGHDYGELILAMYFLHGQRIASRSTLLLPPRLWATNGDTLPVRTRQYRSYEDLVRTIDDENPDIVFLFSGYLFSMHKLLSTRSLEKLLQYLRASSLSDFRRKSFVFNNGAFEGQKLCPLKSNT